jgi:hypothetical protein
MFPYSIRSEKLPVLVHYHKRVGEEMARHVLVFVEKGWDFHVDRPSMRPAITDRGECGPDDAFDVFVWKGHRSCLVNVLSGDSSTAWDDRRGYMEALLYVLEPGALACAGGRLVEQVAECTGPQDGYAGIGCGIA